MLSQDEVDRVVMLASSYGLLMSPSYGSYAHLPLSLVPTRFPENAFKSLIAKTPAHNQLMFLVSKNPKYLYDALKEICQIDDFTNKLVDISRKSHDSKYFQNIFLGLTRNDFMLDGPSNNFLQVEYNTIAASFLSLGTKVLDFHQHVSSLLPNIEASRPYQNNPLFNFAKTIQLAYNLYGNKGAVIFIVLEDEKNIFDQTSLEIELWKNWKIPVIRASLTQLSKDLEIGSEGELLYKNLEISIAYFRSGYAPEHYPSDEEWKAREKIEISKAIKCPNIDFHLSGCKKIQQLLSKQMNIFIQNTENLMENITEIYDFSQISLDRVQHIRENPNKWVLKPQREGGGNNIYGEDILSMLDNYTEHKEYILMKMIECKEQDTWMIKANKAQVVRSVSEVGMFGTVLANGEEIILNEYAGYLVRTKSKDSNEGGVAKGYAVIDSAALY